MQLDIERGQGGTSSDYFCQTPWRGEAIGPTPELSWLTRLARYRA
jgi:hypothetical protein